MRVIVLLSLGFGFALTSGCSMCAPGYLEDYATVGGKWQRGNPTQGRVGSIFSDAGSTIAAGAVGQRVVESHPDGVEGEIFGEAYTENYSEGDYSEGTEEFYELNGEGSNQSFEPEVYDGSVQDPQSGDGILMLGDEW